MSQDREFDIVLNGATGFTGGLTAEYLALHRPPSLRWALSGRSRERLEAVRDRLAAIDLDLAELELIVVDSQDRAGLRELAESTSVVATTVGPYLQYGEPLVAACAAAGTDYADLTGEPEFVDLTWLELNALAERTGARLVHACGFDSVPHDLGALHAVRQLGGAEPIDLRGVVRSSGTFSGGTLHSALGQFARARQMREAMRRRRSRELRPEGRSARAVQGRPHRDPLLDLWLLPLPTIDPFVVARSAAAMPDYGPRFRYSHYAGIKTLPYAAGGALAVGALGVAAQVPPLSRLIQRRIPAGTGPAEDRRERAWFTVDFVGETADTVLHTRVSGGDPGYTETAKMLAESALCLAFDDNPETAGQVTTAQAMGDHLLTRLQTAGMRFETLP